jgi:hypothetical protein
MSIDGSQKYEGAIRSGMKAEVARMATGVADLPRRYSGERGGESESGEKGVNA